MDGLSDQERISVQQLRDLSAGGDDEVFIEVLKSVGWDVQKAAELILDTAHSPEIPPQAKHHYPPEHLEVDDSAQLLPTTATPIHNRNNLPRHSSRPTPIASVLGLIPRPLLTLIVFPFHLLSSIWRFIFNILRIPFPSFRFSALNSYRIAGGTRARTRPPHRGGAERWVHELEEETGAICISRARAQARGITSSTSTSTTAVSAGPSTTVLRSTANGSQDHRRLLPDFVLGTYEETLRLIQREAKVGCIVLVSEEHDDDAEFKRSTLTDPNLVQYLHSNNFVVWGGDVRDADAWSAAEKLQATTYPFVAFVAPQPRRNNFTSGSSSRSPNSSPVMTVLSRHQGRSVPSTSPTSASSLLSHLETQLMPRVKPFLDAIHQQQRQRERDRQLREEQDRAFQEAAVRDKARIEAKMAEERAQKEAKAKAEAEAKAAEERRMQDEREKQRREAKRMDWRRWARKALIGPEQNDPKAIRLAVRFPDGNRVMRFAPASTLTMLYAFVDTQLIPADLAPESDPINPPEGSLTSVDAIEQQIKLSGGSHDWWGFKLALAFPRKEIPWQPNMTISDVEGLRAGGQLVVELASKPRPPPRAATNGDDGGDDGYHTESEDE